MSDALKGKRIVVTRPRAQAEAMCRRLEACGAVPVRFPTIRIAPMPDPAPLDDAIRRLGTFDWIIFTSVNGVSFVAERVQALGLTFPTTPRYAAIGPATAQALEALGLRPDAMPDEYVAERIVDELGDVAGRTILLPRAEQARKALADILTRRGAGVLEVPAYRTLPETPAPEDLAALEAGVDVLTFTSSSTVSNFVNLLGPGAHALARTALVACIGPITAATARGLGLPVGLTADAYTTDGLIDALTEHFRMHTLGL